MSTSRGYRILAGVADVYILSLVLGALGALYTALSRRPLASVAVLAGFFLCIVASITYHTGFAQKRTWLSPGERMHGAVSDDATKRWTNPFGRNRWVLFAANLLALILLGNTWDALGDGHVYGYAEVAGKLIFAAAVVLALVALGAGSTVGVLGPLLLYGGLAIGTLRIANQTTEPETLRAMALVFLILGAVHVGVACWYRFIGKRTLPPTPG